MTDEEMDRVMAVIEMAERLHHKLYAKLADEGVEPVDICIAGFHANLNLASITTGGFFGAFEWMRNAIDQAEKRFLDDVAAGRRDPSGKPVTH